MADPPDSIAQLTAREELAAAEERALNAELARQMARRKVAAILASADRDDRVAALKADATFDAAEGAAAAARLQALTASIGGMPSSGIAGTVTLGEGAGSLETALLAARAATQASASIAKTVSNAFEANTVGHVLVIASGELPTFQAARAFCARAALAGNALIDATVAARHEAIAPVGERLAAAESIGAAGLALDAVSKLLSFFRSDFDVRGVSIADPRGIRVSATNVALPFLSGALSDPSRECSKLHRLARVVRNPAQDPLTMRHKS